MRASVIVPTRNRVDVLARTLSLMLTQQVDEGDYEVIVVDDGSTDGTAQYLRQMQHPRLVFRHIPPAGAATARNHALAIARGEVAVFLDDDAFIAPDFLRQHLAAHDGAAAILAAGGIVDVREPPDRTRLARRGPWTGYHRHPMPGGNASVRREQLLRVHGFDESFDGYGWQDQELAERLLALGLTRHFVRSAPILHYRPAATVLDPRHELERELQRGRMGARFYRKHPRVLVGITTKLWPPIQVLDRILDRMLQLEATAQRILAGEPVMETFRGPRAILLRAHVEIRAGQQELQQTAPTPPARRR